MSKPKLEEVLARLDLIRAELAMMAFGRELGWREREELALALRSIADWVDGPEYPDV